MSDVIESPVPRETAGVNAFAREVLDGLSRRQKTIPASWLPEHGAGAAHNRNLLLRINRELGADFAPSAFRHEARWDAQRRRIEMHLVSEYTQRVTVMGCAFRFAIGESIHTGSVYEHGVVHFQALARAKFAIHVLEPAR